MTYSDYSQSRIYYSSIQDNGGYNVSITIKTDKIMGNEHEDVRVDVRVPELQVVSSGFKPAVAMEF